MINLRRDHIIFGVLMISVSCLFGERVSSQPSFTPDNTPLCDYSIVRGAQNELNKIINDYKLKEESEAKWEVSIDMKEIDLVYEARKYYNCDLKNQLQKPIIFKKPHFPYIPRYR